MSFQQRAIKSCEMGVGVLFLIRFSYVRFFIIVKQHPFESLSHMTMAANNSVTIPSN